MYAAYWNVLLKVLLEFLWTPLNFSPITMQASPLSKEQHILLHSFPTLSFLELSISLSIHLSTILSYSLDTNYIH